MSVEASIYHGSLPLIIDPVRIRYGGPGVLDSGRYSLLVDAGVGFSGAAGTKVSGYHSMWIEAVEVIPEGDLAQQVDVQLIGLAGAGDKRRRSMRVFGRQVAVGPIEKVIVVIAEDETAEDPEGGTAEAKRRIPKLDDDGQVEYKTISTPSGIAERWNINEPIIQVTDTYFITTAPDMSQAGTNVAPTSAPTPPAYLWGGYNEPLRLNHPAGWVLDSRDPEELFNTGGSQLWQVRDVYSYYQPAQPD